MYLASAVRDSFPDIDIRIFHTVTNDNPVLSIEKLIQEFNPDMIGLRSLSIAKKHFKQTAEKIREIAPDSYLIAGGPYPSSSCQDILLSKMADIAVIGEGEITLVDLIDHLQKDRRLPRSLPGTALLESGTVQVNTPRSPIQDIDSISFPDYSLVDLSAYKGITNVANQDASQSTFICSSRGCPYECFYCHQLFGKKIRRRSPDNLLAEMREHVEQRGIRNFLFLDDVFNVPMKAAKETLRRISKELPGIHISFPNGLRADQLDKEMMDLLEEAGTVEMATAVETATPRLQKLIGKKLNLEKAKEAIESASRRFIVRVFFMIGFPTETYEEASETIRLARSLLHVVDPYLSVLRVYEGTRLYTMLEPNKEQVRLLAALERHQFQQTTKDEVSFYGDLFPEEDVPLTTEDIEKLQSHWLFQVLLNKERVQNSYNLLRKHLNDTESLDYFRAMFNDTKLSEKFLNRLLGKHRAVDSKTPSVII
jgi:radical SAM superfamily enzyme YgiQ (UPF0313 family)